ncbi:uncharacterized protein MYCGRDRAFT_110384 [Zymoseptoria tritici IPO323]|uniref:Exonuclease domain-containing protein n=1 Tax=Zymoseptoria tritici (strain CBS 115943 / IPO323) TaxID=336722 RepID=F9XGY7_ZYMTI|nr:uncharacterized protein MYCGRDRAFT_110384 [Zymoseptoria tritici IPO323]EGP84937.1 hypothetical protein MYCGRDRAFT_110384 [Zymoseptoria tritici IPO323]
MMSNNNNNATNGPPRPSSPFQQPNARGRGNCKAQQVRPRMDRLVPGEPVGFDGEFQIVLREGAVKWKQRLAWVAVVNTKGESILDTFVVYDNEEGAEKRRGLPEFGVGKKDLLFKNGAVHASTVEKWLAEIFKDRPVVMRDQSGDTAAFEYETPFVHATIQDTQLLYSDRGERRSLKDVASEVLQRTIQVGGVHTPTEDAATTMELYLLKRPYDRAAEKAKLEANGLPTTSAHTRNGDRGRHNHRSRGGRGMGNGRGALQERAPNATATRGEQDWAGEAFVRPARGGQRRGRGRGGKKNELEE